MAFKEEFKLDNNRLNEEKVFRDSLHSYIHVRLLIIWQLINSEQMQRLRRIKQLGGTYQVFPTAEHSRFTHSLGVYEIVRQMLELDCLKDALSDYDKLCVMIAGLLHDIGHGPFSHCFEDIFKIDHEEMTIRMILENSEVNHILSNLYIDLPKDVADIISKKHKNHLLVQMISSQIDADRMDYLLRDSYMSGTTYGHFDISRLFRTMRLVNNKLVFKESGVHALENYFLARYYMYWQVYYHPSARSYELLLQCIFTRIKDLYKQGYHFKVNIHYLIPFLEEKVTVLDYTYLDEAIIEYYFREFISENDDILKDLSNRFLNRHLFKYKELESEEEYDYIKTISDSHGYNSRYYVIKDSHKQIPYQHYSFNNKEETEILTNKGLKPLPEVSQIVQAIITNEYKEEHKVFFVKEIKNDI